MLGKLFRKSANCRTNVPPPNIDVLPKQNANALELTKLNKIGVDYEDTGYS